MVIFLIFFNMKVYCVFSLEAILMITHNIPFLNIEMKIILNYAKSATMGFVPWDPRTSSKEPW